MNKVIINVEMSNVDIYLRPVKWFTYEEYLRR